MKILSVAIPCYNSQDYMRNCVESLLVGGDDVEIIIVNDGSKDSTAEIANEYALRYPNIVKAVHQEIGGHGEAVNTGLKNSTGVFFKVVDSDDWVNKEAYLKILKKLKEIIESGKNLDMLIANYVYEKVGVKHKKVIAYHNVLPVEQFFTWEDIGHFRVDQYILMHSVIYRTELLKTCGFELPKHTFYVDNIFVFQPLPFVKDMYYMDVNFYRYFIGREDQSVNEKVMISRIDQQIRVTKIMIDYFDYKKVTFKKCSKYMVRYLDIMMTVSSIMLILSGTDENYEKKKELWRYLKSSNRKLYHHLRWTILGNSMNLPGKGGRKVSEIGYKISQKFIGFN